MCHNYPVSDEHTAFHFRAPAAYKKRLARLAAKKAKDSIGRVTESDLLREAVRQYLEREGA